MKKYNEVDALRVIKDLFNMMYGDSKRFSTLRNKFKLSVDDFKVKDGKVTEVSFNAVSNEVINKELNSAIESLESYAARSAKKLAEFKSIIECKGNPSEVGKPKSIKVSKATDGKVKKVAKDSNLPKDSEPKEVKKVKNKNEPAKKPVKETAKKPSKSVVSKSKEEVNTVGDMVSKFVNNLEGGRVSKLISDILFAFDGDAKLKQTMYNWKDKTSNNIDAAIGMLNSAYTRKPKNTKMQDWYKELESTFTDETKHLNAVNEIMNEKEKPVKQIKEAKPKEAKPTKEVKEDIITPVSFYVNVFSHRALNSDNVLKFNPAITTTTIKFLEEVNKLETINFDLINIDMESLMHLYVTAYSEILEFNQELDFESTVLGLDAANCYNSSILANLCTTFNKGSGIFGGNDNKLALLTKFKKFNKSIADRIEFGMFTDLTQTETYILTRKMIHTMIKYAFEVGAANLIQVYIKLFGEVVCRSALHINSLKGYIRASEVEKEVVDNETSVTNEVETSEEIVVNEDIKYSITTMDISFVFRNTSFNIAKVDPRYSDIKDAVINNNISMLDSLIVTKEKLESNIKEIIADSDHILSDNLEEVSDIDLDVKIVDKNIICNNRIYKGALSSEFIKYAAENNKSKLATFKWFIKNCNMNPLPSAIEELYDFVFVNKLTVTPTGTVLLYKWVNEDYRDCHSRTFLNNPGLTIKMDRNRVDSNRHVTCSSGLHLCSYGYGKFGTRLLLCEVHPRDVVSIPTDYNRSKLRCCQYTTLMDITEYYESFNSAGDFLSKCQNIHYNPKILELELMKLYPNITRKNSKFTDINGLVGSEENLKNVREILFKEVKYTKQAKADKAAPTIEDFEEAVNQEALLTEVIDITDDEVALNMELVEGAKEVPVVEEDSSLKKVMDVGEFAEAFNRLIIDKVLVDELLIHENFKNIFFAEQSGYDPVIKNLVIELLELEDKDYTKFSVDEMRKFYWEYKRIFDSNSSIAHVSEEQLENSKDIEDNNYGKNPDSVKVVETPVGENIITKVTGFFKKLF